MRIVSKRLRLELREVVLCLSYPGIKFDDEIQKESIPSNFKHNFGLSCRLSCVMQVYCDETTTTRIARSPRILDPLNLCWRGLRGRSVVIAWYISHHISSGQLEPIVVVAVGVINMRSTVSCNTAIGMTQ